MTMSPIMLLSSVALSFSSVVHAEFRTEPRWAPSALEVVDCKPALDRKDSDPVIVTHVTATFDEIPER